MNGQSVSFLIQPLPRNKNAEGENLIILWQRQKICENSTFAAIEIQAKNSESGIWEFSIQSNTGKTLSRVERFYPEQTGPMHFAWRNGQEATTGILKLNGRGRTEIASATLFCMTK